MEKEIKIENVKLQLSELGRIDPRLIISMAVINLQNIQITHLSSLAPLSKKATIVIPVGLDNVAGVQIKSIQYLPAKSLIVAEIVGSMTHEAKVVIENTRNIMKKHQIMSVFFPGNMYNSDKIKGFIGKTVDEFRSIPLNIRNLRILDDQYLIFSDTGKVKKMLISDYVNGLATNTITLWEGVNQDIKFLGRIKNYSVPITLGDGTIAQLDVKSGKKESVAKTFSGIIKVSAYVGEIFGGKHAVVSGNQLVTA